MAVGVEEELEVQEAEQDEDIQEPEQAGNQVGGSDQAESIGRCPHTSGHRGRAVGHPLIRPPLLLRVVRDQRNSAFSPFFEHQGGSFWNREGLIQDVEGELRIGTQVLLHFHLQLHLVFTRPQQPDLGVLHFLSMDQDLHLFSQTAVQPVSVLEVVPEMEADQHLVHGGDLLVEMVGHFLMHAADLHFDIVDHHRSTV